jgi:hypothetical protein
MRVSQPDQLQDLTAAPPVPLSHLRVLGQRRDDAAVEPLLSHRDVTTIMELLGDMRADLHAIRVLLEEDDGEEEEDPEAHT